MLRDVTKPVSKANKTVKQRSEVKGHVECKLFPLMIEKNLSERRHFLRICVNILHPFSRYIVGSVTANGRVVIIS